jgi:hypothetical protein
MLVLHHRRASRAALCFQSTAAAVGGDLVVDSPPLSLLTLKKRFTSCADPITLKAVAGSAPLKDTNLSATDQELPTGPLPYERGFKVAI